MNEINKIMIRKLPNADKRDGVNGETDSMTAKAKHRSVLSADAVTRLQEEQYRHDIRNHSDIACLAKSDRLKHYGLHYAKYVGRLARGAEEAKSVDRTLTDTTLVCLSAANTLHQHLNECVDAANYTHIQIDPLRPFADAAGRFADACEKIDHLEDFLMIAKTANADIMRWIVSVASERQLDLIPTIKERRNELSQKQFYIVD
jgi:hypothetical protein